MDDRYEEAEWKALCEQETENEWEKICEQETEDEKEFADLPVAQHGNRKRIRSSDEDLRSFRDDGIWDLSTDTERGFCALPTVDDGIWDLSTDTERGFYAQPTPAGEITLLDSSIAKKSKSIKPHLTSVERKTRKKKTRKMRKNRSRKREAQIESFKEECMSILDTVNWWTNNVQQGVNFFNAIQEIIF
jgi:hypothetical protein